MINNDNLGNVVQVNALTSPSVIESLIADSKNKANDYASSSVFKQFIDKPILIPIYFILFFVTIVTIAKSINKAGKKTSIANDLLKTTNQNVTAGVQLTSKIVKKVFK